jgi:hypothetical protein
MAFVMFVVLLLHFMAILYIFVAILVWKPWFTGGIFAYQKYQFRYIFEDLGNLVYFVTIWQFMAIFRYFDVHFFGHLVTIFCGHLV